jgi:hypothetical protein
MSRRALGGGVALLAVASLVIAPQAGAATADRAAASRAAAWLAANAAGAPAGQQADAIVALRAAGRSRAAVRPRAAALARVAPAYATTAGAAAKVAMAAVAAGRDPGAFGGVDYLGRIANRYAAGRYGASAWDQALSLLALRAAGRRAPAAAVRATLAARGTGGWSFDLTPRGRDAVDTTAIVLEALAASGVRRSDARVAAAVRWMLAQRNREGGLGTAGAGAATDANTTAGAIRALRATGRRPPASLRRALRDLQDRDGSVRHTRSGAGSRLLATNDATVALAGRWLPVR